MRVESSALERTIRLAALVQHNRVALCHPPALRSSFRSCSLPQMTLRCKVEGHMAHRTMVVKSRLSSPSTPFLPPSMPSNFPPPPLLFPPFRVFQLGHRCSHYRK